MIGQRPILIGKNALLCKVEFVTFKMSAFYFGIRSYRQEKEKVGILGTLNVCIIQSYMETVAAFIIECSVYIL
jgi:hypothetical protein